MPVLPQFFRYFIPKITTAISSSSRRKATNQSASIEQSNKAQNRKAPYPWSPYGDKNDYIELGERDQQVKAFEHNQPNSKVWTREVSAHDEEKAQT